jgi:Fic family protein
LGGNPVAQRGRPSRQTIFERFESALEELRRFGGLPTPSEASGIWEDLWHLEAHNSTAIEGNTLVLREVAMLLDKRRAVGAKDLKDYMEVLGYGEAARWVYSQAMGHDGRTSGAIVTVTEIRQIHHLAMSKVWEVAPHPDATASESPGGFRQHDIHPFDGGMTPPPWTDVQPQLTEWAKSASRLERNLKSRSVTARQLPIELADLHARFERIHPFLDGNGRTGRLALNLVLVRLGFPPAIIFKRDRNRYLDALDRTDNHDPGALAELIARSVVDNLHRFVVPNIAGPARLVPLRSLVTPEITYEALRQAARRGRLDAEQGSDGTWRSSKHAVTKYLNERFKRS